MVGKARRNKGKRSSSGRKGVGKGARRRAQAKHEIKGRSVVKEALRAVGKAARRGSVGAVPQEKEE